MGDESCLMEGPIDQRLAVYAVERSGVFCWADAQRFCISPRQLAEWTASGGVVRIRRNAYVVGTVWTSAGRRERERLAVQAVVHANPAWAASHQSSFALSGLPLHGVNLAMFDVAAPVSRLREQARVRRHPQRNLPRPDVVGGVRAIPLPWAIAQVASRDGVTPALVALDHALHHELTCLEDVRTAGELMITRLGGDARTLARVLSLADAKCESPGETLTRLLLLDLGHAPTSQVVVHDRRGEFVGRVDFLLEGRVVVEFDGAVKYAGADADEVLRAQSARENRLRALGFVVVRLTWQDILDPANFAARLRQALAQAPIAG